MSFFDRHKTKIFCIGFNKTGTTTMETVLKRLGYRMGNQVKGERLLDAWYQRDFKAIANFCKTADAFQDAPFSLPYTYQALDAYYPKGKFILTVRDDADQWYQSLIRFHAKLFGKEGAIPTRSDLEAATYRRKGYVSDFMTWVYGTPYDQPYEETTLKNAYLNHIQQVQNYFKSRPDKLIIINVSNPDDYAKVCEFLGKSVNLQDFPWENKT